jgi:purine nucleosidase
MSGEPAAMSLVIDTDTASDDAVALLLAMHAGHAAVRAVTVVAGNVPLDLAVRNALVTLDLVAAGDDVAVHPGLAGPLVRPLETAQNVHGPDGMGGAGLAPPRRDPSDEHAVDALRRIARDEPHVHTLVTLGPLSNVAAALLLDPLLLTRFRHTYLMLGSPDGVGNVSTLGEYNAWADPEAAAAVLAAPGERTVIGWNISRLHAVVDPDRRDRLAAAGPLGGLIVDINRDVDHFARVESGLAGFDLPDPIAMAIALDPAIATRVERCHAGISCDASTRGQMWIDRRHTAPPPNCRVVWEADDEGFFRLLLAAASAPMRR